MAIELKGGTLDVINFDIGVNLLNTIDGQFGEFYQVSSQQYPYYSGDYIVTPLAFEQTVLDTSDKIMRDDVTVLEIPYYETSNQSNGITVYIADSVNLGG